MSKQESQQPQVEERPPFNVRVTKSGKYELRHCYPDYDVKSPARGFIEAVFSVDKDAKGPRDAVIHVWQRRGNTRAVLTMAQMTHHKVTRLVTKGGQVLAEA